MYNVSFLSIAAMSPIRGSNLVLCFSVFCVLLLVVHCNPRMLSQPIQRQSNLATPPNSVNPPMKSLNQANARAMLNDDVDSYDELEIEDRKPKSFWDKFGDKLFGEPKEENHFLGDSDGSYDGRNASKKTLNRNIEDRYEGDDGMSRRGYDDVTYDRSLRIQDRPRRKNPNSSPSMPVLLIFLLIVVVCVVVVYIEANYNILEGLFRFVDDEEHTSIEERLVKYGGESTPSKKTKRKQKSKSKSGSRKSKRASGDLDNENSEDGKRHRRKSKKHRKSRHDKTSSKSSSKSSKSPKKKRPTDDDSSSGQLKKQKSKSRKSKSRAADSASPNVSI